MASDKDSSSSLSHGPVGQYYLLDKIAQGGMAEIYKGLAYDLHGIKKTVVIKKILPNIAADKEYINMLIGEAKTAVMLNHGNIAQVYDLGKVGDDYFMVMEFVDGKSLSQIHKKCVKGGDLIPVPYVCYFISEVANGLNYMHRKTDDQGRLLNIIHRDISPQNIIISYSGTVKIVDFGIAKAAIKIDITESGVLKGKFAYMSPEQARGDSIDHRSDIFSLGVILHEILTGRRLFKSENARETLKKVRQCQVPPPSSLRAGLPEEIDRIALKALAADRDKRYFFASEMQNDLVKFIYRNFPDFSPAKVGEFIKDIFVNEILDAKELEEEAKTPFLIIDRTQSAIADASKMENTGLIKAPPHTEPFFTEEEMRKFEMKEEISEQTSSVPRDELPQEKLSVKLGRLFKGFEEFFNKRNRWRDISIVLLIVAAISFVAVIVMNRAYIYKRFVALWPAPQQNQSDMAEIKLDVTPSDAVVMLDGKEVIRQSPAVIGGIVSGEDHTLTIQKDGYVPYSTLVKLRSGKVMPLTLKLERLAPATGTVIVESKPPTATIYLDDVKTRFTTPVAISDLKEGSAHKVGIFLENYKYWSAEFTVRGNATERFSVALEPDYGSLQIISSPSGAAVELNGEYVGETPYQKFDIMPGVTYTVEVSKDGYSGWKDKIKIMPGKEMLINPILEAKAGFKPPEESINKLPPASIPQSPPPQTTEPEQPKLPQTPQTPQIPKVQQAPPAPPESTEPAIPAKKPAEPAGSGPMLPPAPVY